MVQGVGFRYHTRKTALDLGLSGFVMNQPDGTVYIEAEGEETNMQEFIDWCRRGPSMADVSDVTVTDGPLKHFSSFIIPNYF